MKIYKFILLLILLLLTSLWNTGSGQKVESQLQQKIRQTSESSFYKHANLGISVRDLVTGEVLGDLEKDKMLIPASSLKLITTLVGYELLGSDFCYETAISYDGHIDSDGTLKGNIYIEGSGDPTFGSDRISGNPGAEEMVRKMVDDIRSFGIHCLEGNIISDESIYNSFPVAPTWQWNDLGNYYAAGAWGINFNENQYGIYFHRNGPIGSQTKIAYLQPYIPNLELSNEVTVDSADSGDNAYIFGGPYHYGKRIVGTIPQGKDLFRIRGSIPDPPLFLAYKVLKELESRDMGGHIHMTKYYRDPKKNIRNRISAYSSPFLKSIVKSTNDESININCESILKTLGYVIRGNGSGGDGIKVIKDFLSKKKLDIAALHMEDGSGLSARNLISPDLMSKFLYMYARDNGTNFISQLLPEAGKTGTVKNLLTNSRAKGNMWVKSGSMDKTLSYSGYAKTLSGRFVSFSVMLNASSARKMKENRSELEKILEAIYLFL
ncbi:MAG: D-alanyl-D-alanine carboxypeptidase/D-alanyl-D-alanine-endopeptidase [Saprospiraceae bacterium]|nr:D-alanyl-D-alanine carboxypeptidase/D-alanyl-D-alanine-endopeptidase [Saprospiraceae bacterium]